MKASPASRSRVAASPVSSRSSAPTRTRHRAPGVHAEGRRGRLFALAANGEDEAAPNGSRAARGQREHAGDQRHGPVVVTVVESVMCGPAADLHPPGNVVGGESS